MASSMKAALGDHTVKDAPGVGASGGSATSHRPEAAAAAHGRLLSELKEKLRVATPKTPLLEKTTGLDASGSSLSHRPRSYGEGYSTWTQPQVTTESAKCLSTPTTAVPPCNCRRPTGMQARVTLRCRCFLQCADTEATQTDEQAKSSYGPRKRGLVCQLVNRFNEKASLQENDVRAAVDVSKSAPSSALCKSSSTAASEESPEVSEGGKKKEECSLNSSGYTSLHSEQQSSLNLSVSEASRQKLNQDAVDVEANEELSEEDYEDCLDPRIRSRRYIVLDEIDFLNHAIQSQWASVYERLQSSLNNRLRQTLDDCRQGPKDKAGTSQEIIFNKATEEWRQLVTDIKADFHTACVDFDKWRTGFLEKVFHSSCAALHRRQRLWVLGEILRDDLFVSLLIFERRARTRVAALWKKLVERRELS
ncbi:hypothetical protein MRX96_030797 [Rhipicephalus microplus]